MSEVQVLTEEQYQRIMEGKEKAEEMGYKIEENDRFIIITTPQGEKYVFAKPHVAGEVEQVELPREGKRYKAVIKRIKIDKIYNLLTEKGYNIKKLLSRCMEYEKPNERYKCVKRYTDLGYLIEFEVPNLQMEGWQIIRYSTHPNSTLRKLSSSYKGFKKGQEIWVMMDEKGRLKITTPPEDD